MSEFIEYLHEVFAEFGPIRARRMFGGHGIYHNGLMFALVADDVLYLKVNETSRKYFVDRGMLPFEYSKQNRRVTMSYYQVPEEIFEDSELAVVWARRAYQAAMGSDAG